jgi:hypothetical protein
MTPAELATLTAATSSSAVLSTEHLVDRTARTLLFGYTVERHTWHVYLDADGILYRVVYQETTSGTPLLIEASAGSSAGCSRNDEYVPNKRLYPESCDLEFCRLLTAKGVSLPFTSHNPAAHAQRLEKHRGFAGRLLEELSEHEAQYLEFARAHPRMVHSPALASRCVRQALLEKRIPHSDDGRGVRALRHHITELTEALETYADLFDATEEPPSTEEDLLQSLQHLAGQLFGAYHSDAVRAHEVHGATGVVRASFELNHEVDRSTLERIAKTGAVVEELGHQAFRIRNPAEFLDLVAFAQAGAAHSGHLGKPYLVFQRHFGAEDHFKANYEPALRYHLSQR